MSYSVTIDVPDIDAGLGFYQGVFGFTEVARPIPDYVVLDAEGQRLGLMRKGAGSRATPAAGTERRYERHWTPVHMDFHVGDFDSALAAIKGLGGRCEAVHQVPGRRAVAFCSDPFGHGFCLLGPSASADLA